MQIFSTMANKNLKSTRSQHTSIVSSNNYVKCKIYPSQNMYEVCVAVYSGIPLEVRVIHCLLSRMMRLLLLRLSRKRNL